jgi:hypothetical protein
MKFSSIFAAFLLLASSGQSQHLVKDYRRIADKSISKYIDSAVASKVKCETFTAENTNSRTSETYLYNENKNKILGYNRITFYYILFYSPLNVDIRFYITVSYHHHLIDDSSIIKCLPECVRNPHFCPFISSDSAKSISIKNSIQYPHDLNCELQRNRNDNEFYWIITGRPTLENPKVYPNAHARTSITSSQRRIINAKTGHLISMRQFSQDW